MDETTEFTLNGKPVRVATDGQRKLLWVLRYDLGLTGSKVGCGQGICGACTVLVDGDPVRSCSTPVGDVKGKEVVTIEGLTRDGELHPVQKAFMEHDGFQCGFCTPGMILQAVGLLRENPRPSREEILKSMEDNLCRCGAHTRIVAAIESVAQGAAGSKGP
jgi:aerobic-type carbon monoxide dehydrogenase small subunit (CoxS/CutS family)